MGRLRVRGSGSGWRAYEGGDSGAAARTWQKALALLLTIAMVATLVPASPALAEEIAAAAGTEASAQDNAAEANSLTGDGSAEASAEKGTATAGNPSEEGTASEPSAEEGTATAEEPAEEGVAAAAEPTEEDDATAVKPTTPSQEGPRRAQSPDEEEGDLSDAEDPAASSDLAEGEWLGSIHEDGSFTAGVAGQTDEEAPKAYFEIDYDSYDEPCAKLVTVDEGITTLTIPTAIRLDGQSYMVKAIYPDAFSPASETLASVSFYDNSELEEFTGASGCSITSLSLPASVRRIGDEAFSGCTKLADIALPDNLESIGESAFADTALTSVSIPASITQLGDYAFSGCDNLESVTYAEGSHLERIPHGCFRNCYKLGIDAVNSLPASVTFLDADSFYDCDGLEGDLVIPDTVANIGRDAFYDCDGITSVKLPANLDSIASEYSGEPDWSLSAGMFEDCSSLTAVTWPSGDAFDTIPALMFMYCPLSDPTIITRIPATVTTIDSRAFFDCEFEEVDIPDNVNVIGTGAFDCETLKHLEWPQDNGDFDTFYGGFTYVETDVANELLASLPASVKTIANADDRFSIFSDNLTAVDLSSTKVESIAKRAFYKCTGVTSISLPNTLKSIGDEAFACLDSKAAGIDITIPASVTHIGYAAFYGGEYNSFYGSYDNSYFVPSSIHLMNPDFTFEKSNGWPSITIDGESYRVPFIYGQTIYASATDSQGRESFIHKWAQSEATYKDSEGNSHTCKVEDLGKYLQNKDGVGAYTFEWVDVTAPVTVSGTVPVGASLTMTQGTGPAKKVTNVEVSPDGSFSVPASAGVSTVLRISLADYYDYTLTRSASAMKGGWNGISVTTEQMEKIPVKGYLALKLRWLMATDEDGTPSYANIASNDNFTYALVDAEGHEVAFTTQDTILTITANNDDDDTNNIAADAQLTLTATPKASAAATYQVGTVTTTATLQDGTFDAVLPAWGNAAITVNSTDENASSNMRIMVFKGNSLVETGSYMVGQTYITSKLEAGTYTVVAIDSAAGFQTRTLTGLTALGLDDFVARQEVTIADGTQTEVTLTVPLFDTAQIMANAGIKKAAFSLKSRKIVMGGEQTAIIDYQLDTAKTTDAEFRLVLPTGATINSCGSSESRGRVQSNKVTSGDEGDTYAINLADASSGKLYVTFVATTAGDCTVGLFVIANAVTVPVTSGTYTCSALTIVPTTDVLSTTKGSVTVYAAPTEEVTLLVTSSTGDVGPAQTVRTAASCSKTVNFTLPGSPLPSQRYTLTASIGTKDSADYHEVRKQVTYIPGVSLADFTVTNGDNAFPLVKDGEAQEGGITVLYHAKNKKYAYWGFSMTLDASDGQSVDGQFDLYVETLGGANEVIPMKKTRTTTADGHTLATYTGTYTDEVWLDAYEWAVEHNEGQVGNFDWNQVFVPKTISHPNNLFTSIVAIDDEALQELAHKEVEQRQQEQEEMLQTLVAACKESMEEGGDFHERLDSYDEVMQGFIDSLNDGIRKAAADAGETVDESDLIPAEASTIGYFTKEGVGGVTIDDLLFSDDYADPYYDTHAQNADEADWYARLFGSTEFADKDGNTFEATPEELAALAELKAAYDQVLGASTQAEATLGQLFGVGDDLSAYSSWAGVLSVSLEGVGVTIIDPTEDNASFSPSSAKSTAKASPSADRGNPGGEEVEWEERDEYRVIPAPSGYPGFEMERTGRKIMVARYDKFNDAAFWRNFWEPWHELSLQDFLTSSQVADGVTALSNVLGNMNLLATSVGGVLGSLAQRSPEVSRMMDSCVKSMSRYEATATTCLHGLGELTTIAGTTLGLIGLKATSDNYVDTKKQLDETKSDEEYLQGLIELWKRKDEEKCPEKWDCIQKLLDEAVACQELCNLLEEKTYQLGIDTSVTTFCTGVGLLATEFSTVEAATAGAATGLSASSVGSGSVLAVYDTGSIYIHSYRDEAITDALSTYKHATAKRIATCKCTCPPSNPDCQQSPPPTPTDNCKPGMHGCVPSSSYSSGGKPGTNGGMIIYQPETYLDPSGVVYEAVLSNRVEGATVTVWRSDHADGSEKYADDSYVATGQVNPQTTGANGVFQWDVTSGYYQVVVADGDTYTGTSSEWLPVTPPQLDVNLGVVSTLAPTVTSAVAYTDYVEIIFSQWMRTDAVHVTGIDGATCEWVDTEQSGDPTDADDVVYSRVLRVSKPGGFAAGSTVTFGISADGVTSYNGKTLEAVYESGALAVNQRPARILLNIEGDEQGTATQLVEQVEATDDIDAYVVDASGKPMPNQRVTVAYGSNDLATIAAAADGSSTMVVTDEAGKASFTLSAGLPGMTDLTFAVENSTLSRTIDLMVEGVQVRPNRPVAIITDGANVTTIDAASPKSKTIKVSAGATLTLTADEGDEIYYTTNDTCPCTDGSRTKYISPITLQKSTYFRIAAYNGSYDPNEGGYSAYSRRLNLTIEVAAAPVPQVAVKGKTYKVGNYYYKVTNAATNGSGTVTLIKPTATTYTSATVANTVKIYGKSYKITSIATKAFYSNKKLKAVKIGDNVTSVGASAFQGCVALTGVTFGAKVKTVGASAFQGCTALPKVAIGKSVTSLGAKAFYGCKKLKTASLGASLTSVGASAFQGCVALTGVTFGAKVKTVGASAFQGCTALPKVAIGKSVTSIGDKAFYGCKRMTTVGGGAAVVTIGKLAFAACPKLKSFTLASKNLKTIGVQAFSGDSVLKTINIDKTIKLTTVTNSLKGSQVTMVNVMNSKAKTYQKLFKKAGKSVKVA